MGNARIVKFFHFPNLVISGKSGLWLTGNRKVVLGTNEISFKNVTNVADPTYGGPKLRSFRQAKTTTDVVKFFFEGLRKFLMSDKVTLKSDLYLSPEPLLQEKYFYRYLKQNTGRAVLIQKKTVQKVQRN